MNKNGARSARPHSEQAARAPFTQEKTKTIAVHYPGLPSHPQHDLARQQMPGGFGGMVCFDLKGGREAGYQLLQRLQLITLAVSLGGVHSLITHPASAISAVQSLAPNAAKNGARRRGMTLFCLPKAVPRRPAPTKRRLELELLAL